MLNRSRTRKNILIAGGYLLLTIILTYPVILQLHSHIAGFPGEDNLQWRWFLWWFKHSILVLQTPVSNVSLLYAPLEGQQPLYLITSYTPALALPITLLGGATLSFNLTFLLSFALSAYTTYLLAYYLVGHRPAAFVAGLIFGFYPARFGYAVGTFLGQLTTYFLPVYVLTLFMLTRRPTRRRLVLAVLVLTGLCLTWPLHVAYGVIIVTTIFLLFQLIIWFRRPETRYQIKNYTLVFGLAFVLLIGFYLPLLKTVLAGDSSFGRDTILTDFSVDLLAFISPSNHHPILQPLGLLPEYATRVLADDNDIQERLAYVGVVPFLLVVVGLLKFGSRLRFWLVTALTAMLLSLGPLLKFNGGPPLQINIENYVGYIVLPYALIAWLPIINWSDVLGRFNVITMLSVGVMAAYGVSWLVGSLKPRWQIAAVAGLSLLILLEFVTIFPFPTEPDITPVFYTQLQQEAHSRPQQLIDLPLIGDPAYNNYSMHYQTVHHQPIAGGHFMRKPDGARETLGFINQLLSPPLEQAVVIQPDSTTRLSLLNRWGFTKIVARQAFLADNKDAQAQLTYLSTWLGEARPAGEVSVIEIPSESLLPPVITTLLAGDGWQPVGDALQLQSPADLLVNIEAETERRVTLQLSLSAPTADRHLMVEIKGRPAASFYLASESLHYNLPLLLSPGAHQITFWPAESCLQKCPPVNFSHLELVDSTSPTFTPIDFDSRLALLEYDLAGDVIAVHPGQPILIYLYWQGIQQNNADYSAFIHLVSSSGELIEQVDYLIGGWHYATSAWPVNYIAAAPSLFFIPPDTPPGEYSLQVGVYQAQSGERLPTNGGAENQTFAIISTLTVE